jgi:3-hydroxy acid dehydrogenase / malonic semialdehyde reductase
MIIFISGATSGFGWAMAELFTQKGHRVIATGRRQDKLLELKKSCGDLLYPLTLDIRSKESVKQAIDNLPNEWKDIEALINNAGLALGAEMAQNSQLEDWEEMIQTNINGLLYLTHFI